MSQQRSMIGLLVLAGLLGIPGAATAQNQFSVLLYGQTQIDSPTPISTEGGDTNVGGSARADSPLKAEAHAYVPPTNALSSDYREFFSQALTHHEDVVISGPGPTVLVKLHLPFHANFTQSWKSLTDGTSYSNSSVTQSLFVSGFFASAGTGVSWAYLQIDLNRAADLVTVTPLLIFGGAEFHPTPRDPSAPRIDADGYLTQFARQVTPITGAPPYGGFGGYSFDEIDEARGEIVLILTVLVDTPLRLDLNLQVRSTATSFLISDAYGSLDARDTFGVPQDGTAVFELPDGYTANSPSLHVVNNVVPSESATCPQPQGYWKNNPGAWPSVLPALGSQTYTAAELLTILQTPVGSGSNADASLILADQLIAAKLNISNGSDPAPINAAIATADSLLSGFSGKLPYKVKPSSAIGKQMTATASALEGYNLLQLTPSCTP